jgi:methionyl-tRNA formyltransferase
MGERILFVGGKNIGNGILRTLVRPENVVGVYSNPSDLKKDDWYLTLKPITTVWNIPYSVENINKQSETIKEMEPDWLICAYYDRIVSDKILGIPKKGSINIHMGLATEYKGCYPTLFPILDGKDHAGVTIHQMTSDVDGGDIYAMKEVNISPDETGRSLYDKCTLAAVELFNETWPLIKEGNLEPQKNTGQPVYHTREDFPGHEIDLHWDRDKIDRYARALTFPPFPRPYFMIRRYGHKFEIKYERKEDTTT